MDIISIVNTMRPGTISRLAKEKEDFHGEDSIPFMGVFVQVFPGAQLPSEDAVKAYQPTYETALSEAQQAETAKAALPDLATQVAHLTAAIVNSGVALPEDVITAANEKLSTLDQPLIEVESAQIARRV